MGEAATKWKVLGPTGDTVASRDMSMQKSRRAFLSAYNGANRGRFFADWEATYKDADNTLLPERQLLINRTRERARNDLVMRGIMNKIVDAIVGPKGFRLTADLDYERLGISQDQANDIETAIDRECELHEAEADYSGNHAKRMTQFQIDDLLYRNEIQCGETLVIPRWINRAGYRFRFCLQVLETDRIINPYFAGRGYSVYIDTKTGDRIVDGVRIGTRGDVKGIYLAKQHPGAFAWGVTGQKYETTYIPAINFKTGRPNFWLRSACYRPEAVRGEPGFAASLAGFRRIGEFVGSQLQLAQLCADQGIIMETLDTFTDANDLDDDQKIGSEREREQLQQSMDPYSIAYAPQGTKPHVVGTDTPGPQFDQFVTRMVGMIGNAHGLHFEQANGDLRGMTWATSKASSGITRRGQEKEQKRFIDDYRVMPRQYVIEEAWLAGRLDLPGFDNPELRHEYFRHTAYASQWPDLQPVDEETAAKMRMENGISNEWMECERRGTSFEKVIAGRVAARDLIEKQGLELPEWYKEEIVPQIVSPSALPAAKKKDPTQ